MNAYPNAILEQMYTQKIVLDHQNQPINPFPYSVLEGRGRRLYEMVKATGAVKTLEVGFAYGGSGQWIMCASQQNSPDFRHVAIDPFQNHPDHIYRGVGVLNALRAGFGNHLDFYEKESYLALPEILANVENVESFDFIFIDGMHLLDYVIVDFFYCDRLLKPGGLLVLDDAHMASQRKAFAYIARNRYYELAKEFHIPMGRLEAGKRKGQYLIEHPTDVHAVGDFAFDRDLFAVFRKLKSDDRHIVDGGWRQYETF